MSAVFLTGATGLVGSAAMHAILERTDHDVIALVRAADGRDANGRIEGALGRLVDDPAPWSARVTAVAGDALAPGLGLKRNDKARVLEHSEYVLHSAASVRFDEPLADARRINRDAVAATLELADEIAGAGRLRRMLHVSTAFVAGDCAGAFLERDRDRGQVFRNTYERTKLEGELLVHAARDRGLPAIVARPSIIVGESTSGWTSSFNVVYGPLRLLAIGAFEDGIPYAADSLMDIVTLDYVTDAIVHLLLFEPAPPPVAAIVAGDQALTVGELCVATSAAMGMPIPPLDIRAEMPPELTELSSYNRVRTRFDDRDARAVLNPAGIVRPPLADGFTPLIRFGRSVRWGKRPITRERARREVGLGQEGARGGR
jgi:thioester reductase-like protein